jgi:hypothetical protein
MGIETTQWGRGEEWLHSLVPEACVPARKGIRAIEAVNIVRYVLGRISGCLGSRYHAMLHHVASLVVQEPWVHTRRTPMKFVDMPPQPCGDTPLGAVPRSQRLASTQFSGNVCSIQAHSYGHWFPLIGVPLEEQGLKGLRDRQSRPPGLPVFGPSWVGSVLLPGQEVWGPDPRLVAPPEGSPVLRPMGGGPSPRIFLSPRSG